MGMITQCVLFMIPLKSLGPMVGGHVLELRTTKEFLSLVGLWSKGPRRMWRGLREREGKLIS
jgi:hypothetical protein|tara:strand:- start:1255 stop:1440 length:186 start_codon:yes stop_codon:yes gene_type:complete